MCINNKHVHQQVVIHATMLRCAWPGRIHSHHHQVKAEMERAGVKPNVYTFNALLAAAEETACLDLALEVLDEMQATRGVEPDAFSFTTAISCCGKAGGEWEVAIQLSSQMRAAGIPPTLVVYNALLAVLTAAGQWQRALRLFNHLCSQPIFSHASSEQRWIAYSTTIEALAGAAQWQTAAALLRRARAEGLLRDCLQWRLDTRIDLHDLSELGAELVVRCWLGHLREEAGVGRRVEAAHVWIVTGMLIEWRSSDPHGDPDHGCWCIAVFYVKRLYMCCVIAVHFCC